VSLVDVDWSAAELACTRTLGLHPSQSVVILGGLSYPPPPWVFHRVGDGEWSQRMRVMPEGEVIRHRSEAPEDRRGDIRTEWVTACGLVWSWWSSDPWTTGDPGQRVRADVAALIARPCRRCWR
jgi:hypothetical protein